MKNVRPVRKDEHAVSPVIATILMVAITVVLAAVLYVMAAAFIIQPQRITHLTVTVESRGTNWMVSVVQTPADLLPDHTYLLVRSPQGATVLPKTAWSALTPANWDTTKALYDDANPDAPEIRAADALLLDRDAFPAGSEIVISDSSAVLASRNL